MLFYSKENASAGIVLSNLETASSFKHMAPIIIAGNYHSVETAKTQLINLAKSQELMGIFKGLEFIPLNPQ